jgi:hypothetical protein
MIIAVVAIIATLIFLFTTSMERPFDEDNL